MGRFATSWAITKASLRIVREDKELLVLPVLSAVAGLVLLAAVVGVGWTQGLFPTVTDAQGHVNPLSLLLLAVLYLGLAFVNVFFGAAVVAGAAERMAGGNPTLGSCLRAAARRSGRLLAWAAITATVSILLQVLRERGGLAGRITAGLGSLAWGLATYFAIPVLLFEDVAVGAAIGRSGSLFKKTWGESVIGTSGVGLVFGVATAAVVVVGMFAIQAVLGAPGGIVTVVAIGLAVLTAIVLLLAVQSVLSSVYKSALYRYATTGQLPAGFAPEHIANAFVPR